MRSTTRRPGAPVAGLMAIDHRTSKARSIRVVEEVLDLDALLGWDYTGLCAHLAAIPQVRWLQPDGQPDPAWHVSTGETWAAARAGREAAGDTAMEAAGAAICYVCTGRDTLAQEYRTHLQARWEVWQKGYALLCDVAGRMYVYAQGGTGETT